MGLRFDRKQVRTVELSFQCLQTKERGRKDMGGGEREDRGEC